MNKSNSILLDLLSAPNFKNNLNTFSELEKNNQSYLNAEDMALLYTKSAMLVAAMSYIKDQLWLNRDKELNFHEFIESIICRELKSVHFLKDFLKSSGEENIKRIGKMAQAIESNTIELILKRPLDEHKTFTTMSLNEMKNYFLAEERAQSGHDQREGHQGLQLYRSFDKLDLIFDLNYKLDQEMVIDSNEKERLYEGAGVGVQSGYSTILLALEHLSPRKNATIVDLGSGYGRVGIVCGLLREDIKFIGYEFVPHRVDVSNTTSHALGLNKSLEFITQDLSKQDFKIPEADIYYLYDPFTKETYKYILDQITEISKKKPVTIVTKGNARDWLLEVSLKNNWEEPETLDEGNLCIFRS